MASNRRISIHAEMMPQLFVYAMDIRFTKKPELEATRI